MKKSGRWVIQGILLAILLLTTVLSATATISFDPLPRTTYNVGESATLNGAILENKDFRGKFTLQLVCGDQKTDILIRLYSFRANERVLFQEVVSLPSTVGECFFQGTVNDGVPVIDSAQSPPLRISDALQGNVTINPTAIQLGETVVLTGMVKTVAGDPVSGSVVITVRRAGDIILVNRLPVTNGAFRYSFTPLFLSSGIYDVDLSSRDVSGNRYGVTLPLSIAGDLILNAKVDKSTLIPGDVLQLTGNLSYAHKTLSGNASVTLQFAGQNSSVGPLPSFSSLLVVNESLPRGTQQLQLLASDLYGNEGTWSLNITLTGRPTVIQNTIIPVEVLPGAEVSLRSLLSNQYEEKVERLLDVAVWRGESLLWEGKTQSGVAIPFKVANFTAPGELTFRSRYQLLDTELTAKERGNTTKNELSKETPFKILELREIESRLEGSQVRITNVGNVRYAELINFTLVGGKEYVINKFIDLQPAEEVAFDLGGEVPSDNYTVILPLESATVPNVTVEDTAFKEDLQEGLIKVEERMTSLRKIFFVSLVVLFLGVTWWTIFRHHQATQQQKKDVVPWNIDHAEGRRKAYQKALQQNQQQKVELRKQEAKEWAKR